jgi:hypothetical protein
MNQGATVQDRLKLTSVDFLPLSAPFPAQISARHTACSPLRLDYDLGVSEI